MFHDPSLPACTGPIVVAKPAARSARQDTTYHVGGRLSGRVAEDGAEEIRLVDVGDVGVPRQSAVARGIELPGHGDRVIGDIAVLVMVSREPPSSWMKTWIV